MKTWDDLECAAIGEPWSDENKFTISGEPLLHQAATLVRKGSLTREQALLQLVFGLIDIKNHQQKMILEFLNASPGTPLVLNDLPPQDNR